MVWVKYGNTVCIVVLFFFLNYRVMRAEKQAEKEFRLLKIEPVIDWEKLVKLNIALTIIMNQSLNYLMQMVLEPPQVFGVIGIVVVFLYVCVYMPGVSYATLCIRYVYTSTVRAGLHIVLLKVCPAITYGLCKIFM